MTQLVSKDPKVGEFRTQAEALRAKLVNPEEKMTNDEVKQTTDAITALEMRAAAIAGFTPQEEVDRQGGDQELRQDSPEAVVEVMELSKKAPSKYALWSRDTVNAFGTVDNYIRSVVDPRLHMHLSKQQMNCINRGKALALRSFGRDDLEHRSTILGTTGDSSGGEFLLPLQQESSIFQVENNQVGMIQRATRYPVTGRTLRIPYVVQTDGGVTRPMAGIAAITIVGEGQPKPEREPKFLQRLLTVYKWAAISKIGDETIADDMTGELTPTITRLVGGQVMNEMNDYMTFSGTGTGQPLGALNPNNPSLLVVERDTTQAVSANDIFRMWSRHTHGPGSYWSVSRRVMEQLFGMTLGSNTLVTFLRDLTGAPTFTLLGYPVVISDFQPSLGVQGDIALINPAFYAVALRTQLTVESSIHVEFVNDITTYRFFARGGGVPIPDGTYAYKANGGNKIDEHSPFVVLGDVITS